MKKEIVICDHCKRQLNQGERYVTRSTSSSTYDTRVEDVCMGCVYPNITTTTITAVGIDPLFIKAANEEFWNIL